MEISFTGMARITLEWHKGMEMPKLLTADVGLSLSDNLDADHYVERGTTMPNGIAGVKALTQALLQGLQANIRAAHHHKHWNESEHIRYVIDELQRGFVEQIEIGEGRW
jgi:hypothetical protein